MLLPTNFRISQKIMMLVAGLAFGFVAIGIAYFIQMTTEQSVQEQKEQLAENRALLDGIRIDVIELNSELTAFVSSRDSNSLLAVEEIKQRLSEKVAILRGLAAEIGISGDLVALEGLLSSYEENYQKSIDVFRLVGDPTGEGLLAELNESQSLLSDQVKKGAGGLLLAQYVDVVANSSQLMAEPSSVLSIALQNALSELQKTIDSSTGSNADRQQMQETVTASLSTLSTLSSSLSRLQEFENNLNSLGGQLLATITEASSHVTDYAQKITSEIEYKSQFALAMFVGLSFAVVMAMAIGVFLIYKSIVFPMAHIQSVIRRINRGKLKSRVKLTQDDELGDLGRAFNILLDERIQTLEEQSLENEHLNNSIISLIRALGAIAQKNLTVKVPVSADITGTISDAVNLLTNETAKTLAQVKDISVQVNGISDQLQEQSISVLKVAEDERKQVMATSKALDLAARAMNEIASRAETADKIASKTISDTQAAREAVTKSIQGILTIRETISETEKRIKRLGDRSQEISGIVNLINTIAERTHILALNASMHAASAGEAGKGFAVVADEVQRLAENAREATAEIASMVNNIRIETSDTVNVMNKLITEVAQGTRLAEQAGKRMEVTEDATRQLVETVQAISHSSIHQAQISNKIRDRATIIRNFTEKTGGELAQQQRHTDNLKHCAEVLLERVNVFELPEHLDTPEDAVDTDSEPMRDVG